MRSFFAVFLLLAGGVAALVVVVWPGGAPATVPGIDAMPPRLGGKPQGHVYSSAVEEPADVNPLTARGAVAQSLVLGVTHDALLDRDPRTGELRNALAGAHELATDGRSCTFVLREGVVFSDGTPLTMADVMFGWELAQAGHLPMGFVGNAFSRVQRVDVMGERTLRVHFRDRYFANVGSVGEGWLVAQRGFFMARVRRNLVAGEEMPGIGTRRFAELLGQVDLESGPGTGPYTLHNDAQGVSYWQPRVQLLLVRNESSWRRRVRPGTWNFSAMKLLFRDPSGARNALLLGEVDWYSGANVDELLAQHESVAALYQKHVYDYPQLGVYRIVWNCQRAPFDDVRVRRALSLLIPRQDVVAVLGGDGHVAVAHAKPGSPVYPDDQAPTFDPAAARSLLRSAGFDPAEGKPLRVTLLALQGSEALRRITELVQDAAQQAGIVMQVRSRELAAFVAEQKRGEWDGSLVLQWFDASGDPYRFLHSNGRSNPGAWSNPEADVLAIAARLEMDPVARNGIWRELHSLAHRDQPAALVVHPVASVLLNRNLRDYRPGAYGLRPEWAWMPESLQRQR
ncbi:MAG: ABC-type transport system substrate-binding protein [Planctomycetota bacterium]|jgi:ABC-type transport system substrate-binding protein